MAIRVKLHGRARAAAGSDEIEVAETVKTVGDLLDELTRRIGPDFSRYIFDSGTKEMSANLIMLVNGHSVKMLEGLRTPLLEHDMVTIDSVDVLEIVGGG
jgi:molybdopterin converting factor small subunit